MRGILCGSPRRTCNVREAEREEQPSSFHRNGPMGRHVIDARLMPHTTTRIGIEL
jgi:hypothetical protein